MALEPLNPKNASVLIVEDNPDDALIVSKALHTFGIKHIYDAETAEDALDVLRERPCDVALIDYNLPGINGGRLLEQITEAFPHTQVIIVTGGRDDRIAAEMMKKGAADYVAKGDMLTSSVIRSLQSTLRDSISSTAEERAATIAPGNEAIERAREEADWLLETFQVAWSSRTPTGDPFATATGDGETELLASFDRYLRASISDFPDVANVEEDALVRMLIKRACSPGETVAIYRAALRCLAAAGIEPPFSPTVCLARVFAALVQQQQFRRALARERPASG